MGQYRTTVEDILREGTHTEVEMIAKVHPKHVREMNELERRIWQVNSGFDSQLEYQDEEESWRSVWSTSFLYFILYIQACTWGGGGGEFEGVHADIKLKKVFAN